MSKLYPPVTAKDHTRGSDNPQVQIVEYGDFQCPHCGAAEPIMEKIFKKFGSAVSITFRNFPLSDMHPMAFEAACVAEAAGKQEKYWEMHDYIFAHQDSLSNDMLIAAAKKIGLDVQKLVADTNSKEVQDLVNDDFENGAESGVNGTPSFFVNGKRFDGGADNLYELLNESVK